ncbi:MAG: TonB-dependent receptor [Oceanihabitans sp.]
MKKFTKFLFLVVAITFATGTMAQSTVTGTLVDAEMNAPLATASVVEKGTTNGVSSDFDGNFTITTNAKSGVIVISYVGYTTISLPFNGDTNLGEIVISADNSLEEVIIIGSGVIDLAEDRSTPIAVSTIKAIQIQEKAGNSDLPELLKSTPSVQTTQRGGFGDGQMFLRGFDQTNTAFLLNGQPINGMEDGKMYWSNWSGVLDVANAVQVQRGLGSSKLAISSVGGTVNIVTKTIDKKEGGFLQQMIANDNYTKTTAYYSTGLMENGLAVSAMFGHWQGEGYVDHTEGQGQTYFLSFGYKVSDSHILNLMVTGAPQWHAAAGGTRLKNYLDPSNTRGRRLNTWNTSGVNSPNNLKSGVYPGGRNVYHKPVANLNWDWNINEKSALSTVLYGSLGRGAFVQSRTNSAGEVTYGRGSNNNHNWYGLVTNYNNQLNENLSFNVGADVRLYNGIHFRSVNELISVDSVGDSSDYNGGAYEVSETFGGINPWNILFNTNDDHAQRLHPYYDYEEDINYTGVFGQLEYSKDKFSAFFQGSASTQSHVRTEYGNASEEGKAEESKKVNNLGYNLKLGGAYKINDQNTVFLNTGFYSRQPYHSDLFVDDRGSNQLNPLSDENQKITGIEAGYKFMGDKISANLNLYYTIWDNRIDYDSEDTLGANGLPINDGVPQSDPAYNPADNIADVFFATSGIKQVHFGGELEVFARPIDKLELHGFLSVGNWEYDGDVTLTASDEDGNVISQGDTSYIDGAKVGNAAQFTAGIGAKYEILPRFKIDANWNQYDKLYGNANYGGGEFSTKNNRGSIELPSYDTVDAGLSYKWLLGESNNSLQFRLNINNIFDEVYLEYSDGNEHVETGDDSWKGVNTNNRVRFGYGRTWNFSMRFNF